MSDNRVSYACYALYSKPRVCAKRRRCDGHLSPSRHMIEVGDVIVWSSLPPDTSEIGNIGWWHHAYCGHCAPIETVGDLYAE